MLAVVDVCQANPAARGRLCACLEPTALGRLRAVAGDARLVAGQTLFAEGEIADSVYGLRQGSMMLSRRLPDGRRQVLSFLFPGDMFGFAADGRHACAAIALQRASVCRIPLAATVDVELAARLHAVARARLADALAHTLRLGRMSAGERVADFFYGLWCRLDRPAELHLPMRVVDVADHLGLRMETVSRAMAALRRDGLIGPLNAHGVMAVMNGDALQRR